MDAAAEAEATGEPAAEPAVADYTAEPFENGSANPVHGNPEPEEAAAAVAHNPGHFGSSSHHNNPGALLMVVATAGVVDQWTSDQIPFVLIPRLCQPCCASVRQRYA